MLGRLSDYGIRFVRKFALLRVKSASDGTGTDRPGGLSYIPFTHGLAQYPAG